MYSANLGPATSQAVNLPADGRNLYVRLWTEISTWGYTDYTYKGQVVGYQGCDREPGTPRWASAPLSCGPRDRA